VIQYATSRRCRQLEILDYFGDPSKQTCGTCDNCPPRGKASGGRKAPEQTAPPANSAPVLHANSPATLDVVRMVLSGAARMKGRYGKQMLAKMLIGSKAKELSKGGLERLSTYGLLANLKESEALILIDALLAVRLLMQVEETPRRPLVRLTPRGEEVMKGAELIEQLRLDARLLAKLNPVSEHGRSEPASQPTSSASASDFDEPDPFDAANAELVEPSSFEDEPPPAPRQAIHPPATNQGLQPPHYWTWRVLASGFSAAECQQIRGLSADELCEHLLQAAQSGQPVEPGWVLNREQIAALERAAASQSPEQIKAGMKHLPPGISQRHWQLFLLMRRGTRCDLRS